MGFWGRLFGRGEEPEAVAPPEPIVVTPEPMVVPEPVTIEAAALPPEPEPEPEPAASLEEEDLERRLTELLDSLGSAHRKPFTNA